MGDITWPGCAGTGDTLSERFRVRSCGRRLERAGSGRRPTARHSCTAWSRRSGVGRRCRSSRFDTPYALATQKIATDGVDIFVHYAHDDLARAADGQRPFREMINDYLHYIDWDSKDKYASSLRLRQYPDVAPVIIDPRFGWGAPVVASTKVPVDAIVDLWLAGESLEDVAYEYGLTREQSSGNLPCHPGSLSSSWTVDRADGGWCCW